MAFEYWRTIGVRTVSTSDDGSPSIELAESNGENLCAEIQNLREESSAVSAVTSRSRC